MDEAYTEADHRFRESDRYAGAKYEITLRWLGRTGQGRRLLNVGCGSGLFNKIAADAGFRVEACEPDPRAYEVAQSQAPPGVIVHNAGIFDLMPRSEADVIVMHDVLEHIDAESAALDRLAELLSPAGRVVVSVPALPRLYGYHDELLGHYRRYSGPSLRVAMGRRFQLDRLRYFGASFIPVTYWFSCLRRKPYPMGAAAGGGAVAWAFSLACDLEARTPAPIGTSLLCLAHLAARQPEASPSAPS